MRQIITAEQRAVLPRLNVPPVAIGSPRDTKLLPRKYIETLEHNQKLNGCCRRPDDSGHTAQMFATPTAVRDEHGNLRPDLLIIVCGVCARKHYRVQVGEL